MLEWRECEHEAVDDMAMNNPAIMRTLRDFSLYKFRAIQGMRAQVELMTWLVNKWDVQEQCFIIGDHKLEIELEDIYFLIGLPKEVNQSLCSGLGKVASLSLAINNIFVTRQLIPKTTG